MTLPHSLFASWRYEPVCGLPEFHVARSLSEVKTIGLVAVPFAISYAPRQTASVLLLRLAITVPAWIVSVAPGST